MALKCIICGKESKNLCQINCNECGGVIDIGSEMAISECGTESGE